MSSCFTALQHNNLECSAMTTGLCAEESHYNQRNRSKNQSFEEWQPVLCIVLKDTVFFVIPAKEAKHAEWFTWAWYIECGRQATHTSVCPWSQQEYLISWPPPPFNPSEDNQRLQTLKMTGEAGLRGVPSGDQIAMLSTLTWGNVDASTIQRNATFVHTFVHT